MDEQKFYITTPIYYVNDKPHLGNSYTTIMCDILRRYHSLLGHKTFMLTGTDEYGQNTVRVAKAQNRDVREMVDANSAIFRSLWPDLYIEYDRFIRTTDEDHRRLVQDILQKTFDSGDIYMADYGGNYCTRCERFYTDTETEAKPGFCPIHDTEFEYIKETNYFLKLGKYQDWLREMIEQNPNFIRPAQFRSEVLAFLREPLEDLCISRPVERLSWGIPLPFDNKFVTYVWYDALINYLTGIGYPDDPDALDYWRNCTHMIGKDILRQHAIFWPCMLKAAGIDLFHSLRVHGWWTVEGRKMGKSMGNVVDPVTEVEKYGVDIFRYFLAREMTFGSDGDYSSKALVGRNNAELANDLGNLLSRVTAMIQKYCDGQMPPIANPTEDDLQVLAKGEQAAKDLPDHLERAAMHSFLEKVMGVISAANGYVTLQQPWSLAKAGQAERVGTVLAVTARVLVEAAQLLYPVMPGKMQVLLASFSLGRPIAFRLDPILPGTSISPAPALFPRLEYIEAAPIAATADAPAPIEKPTAAPEPLKAEIAYDDFAKVDLRVATILEAEQVPKTDKLMRLTIDIGVEKRQIVAGVAQHYSAEQLIGRQIIMVANLAPRKLKGLTSQGMLLAGKAGDALFLLKPDEALPPGADVS